MGVAGGSERTCAATGRALRGWLGSRRGAAGSWARSWRRPRRRGRAAAAAARRVAVRRRAPACARPRPTADAADGGCRAWYASFRVPVSSPSLQVCVHVLWRAAHAVVGGAQGAAGPLVCGGQAGVPVHPQGRRRVTGASAHGSARMGRHSTHIPPRCFFFFLPALCYSVGLPVLFCFFMFGVFFPRCVLFVVAVRFRSINVVCRGRSDTARHDRRTEGGRHQQPPPPPPLPQSPLPPPAGSSSRLPASRPWTRALAHGPAWKGLPAPRRHRRHHPDVDVPPRTEGRRRGLAVTPSVGSVAMPAATAGRLAQ